MWKFRIDQNEGKIKQIILKTAHSLNLDLGKLNYVKKTFIRGNSKWEKLYLLKSDIIK